MLKWDTSCLDWKARLLSGRSLVPDLPLFREEAERALRVFKRLRVPDLYGKPAMGDVAGPWLFPIVEAIFGSFDPEIQRRMIQEFFWLIPKKNGKTSTAAAIMVEALILNRRPEGEFVLIGPTKETADISFRQAAGTIRADSELDKLFQIQTHIRKIQHRRTGASLQVKAADTDVITGGKQVGTMIDEVHVLGSKPNADEILVELRGALTARPDGFLIFVTTQSKKPPVGIFKSELAKARDVRDGKLKLPLLPILYELPLEISENGGWKDRRYWQFVNPNMGRSVDEEFLVRNLEAAETEGAAQLALLASQHFNVEVGQALRTDRWAGADEWQAAADPELVTLEDLLARSEVVTVGIDGGGLDDLLGVAVVGRERETRRWLLWAHAWAYRSVFERRKEIVAKLRDLEKDGELTVIEELGQDIEGVVEICEQIAEAGLFPEKAGIGLDPAGVGAIVDALAEKDLAGDLVVGVSQGWPMTGAIKTTERKLADGTLKHTGGPLLAWSVGNAKTEPRGNALIITKATAGSAKIDALMAAFDAVSLMSRNPTAKPRSYLETDELLVL